MNSPLLHFRQSRTAATSATVNDLHAYAALLRDGLALGFSQYLATREAHRRRATQADLSGGAPATIYVWPVLIMLAALAGFLI